MSQNRNHAAKLRQERTERLARRNLIREIEENNILNMADNEINDTDIPVPGAQFDIPAELLAEMNLQADVEARLRQWIDS